MGVRSHPLEGLSHPQRGQLLRSKVCINPTIGQVNSRLGASPLHRLSVSRSRVKLPQGPIWAHSDSGSLLDDFKCLTEMFSFNRYVENPRAHRRQINLLFYLTVSHIRFIRSNLSPVEVRDMDANPLF